MRRRFQERKHEEKVAKMIRELRIKPGMIVADIGCGVGYHALMMAPALEPAGKVLCVDIQQGMLDQLKKRAEKAGVTNYEAILGESDDPLLPASAVDLVLLVDVYHEFSGPAAMLAKIHKSLKSDGLVVLVEFREEDPDVPIKLNHKMSKKQIMKEMRANNFRLVRSYDHLPWQHMMFFGKK